MLVCILAFCRQRLPASYAYLAALLAATSCRFYATEGRCYGLLLGCAAGALLCWQQADDDDRHLRYAAGLAVLLMVMTALHYYSIFFLIPLGCGEIARWRKRRRVDFAVLAAMFSAVAVLLLHLPLVMKGERYAEHFWSPASWYQLPEFYLKFALIPAVRGFGCTPGSRPDTPREAYTGVAIRRVGGDYVACVGPGRSTCSVQVHHSYFCIPLHALECCRHHHPGNERDPHTVPAARPKISWGLIAALLAVLVVQEGFAYRESFGLRESDALLHQLKSVPAGSEPIAVGYSHAFMELAYYAPPELRSRIVCPVSRELDLQHKGFVDLDFSRLPEFQNPTKLAIIDLNDFLSANRHFILAAHTKDYLPQYLQSVGYELTVLNPGQSPSIYEVAAPRAH